MHKISIPQVRRPSTRALDALREVEWREFGFAIHARQTCAIAGTAFGSIAKSAAGLALPVVTILVVLLMPALIDLRGVPLLPRTAQVLTVLTAPVADHPRLPGY